MTGFISHICGKKGEKTTEFKKKKKIDLALYGKTCYNMQVCCVDMLKEDVP